MGHKQRKKSSIGKWFGLLTAFVGAMCCICLGFAFVTGAANNLTAIAALQPPTTTAVAQLPTPTVERVPATTFVTQTQAPTNTFRPSPTADLSPVIPQDTPTVASALPASGNLRFHFVDVAQGDSTVIQTAHQNLLKSTHGKLDVWFLFQRALPRNPVLCALRRRYFRQNLP